LAPTRLVCGGGVDQDTGDLAEARVRLVLAGQLQHATEDA
jgi:hypothetical protein